MIPLLLALMLNQPMSSPQMIRMLGLVCASFFGMLNSLVCILIRFITCYGLAISVEEGG